MFIHSLVGLKCGRESLIFCPSSGTNVDDDDVRDYRSQIRRRNFFQSRWSLVREWNCMRGPRTLISNARRNYEFLHHVPINSSKLVPPFCCSRHGMLQVWWVFSFLSRWWTSSPVDAFSCNKHKAWASESIQYCSTSIEVRVHHMRCRQVASKLAK